MPHSTHKSTSPGRIIGRYIAINGDSKPANFLQKLYDFLSLDPHPCPEIIYWAADSKQLVIAQPDKLAKEVLPKLFKHDKIASFGRQLNIYGFSRLFPGRQFKDSSGNVSDASVWAHPTLNRQSTPSDLLTIKRRAPPKLIRTRRLANGEIIKTKAGPGVIEKAKKIKESMISTKSRERSLIWNNKSQAQLHLQNPRQDLKGDINMNINVNVKSENEHSCNDFSSKFNEMRRNSTTLADIIEYPEKDLDLDTTNNNHNNLNSLPLDYIPNSASTIITASSNSNWSHTQPDSGNGSIYTSSTSPASSYTRPTQPSSLTFTTMPNPIMISGERPYSSCPASIHTSPDLKHPSLPLRSSWNSSLNSTLTSSINTSSLDMNMDMNSPYKPNLTISTHANQSALTSNMSSLASTTINTPSFENMQLPQLPSQILIHDQPPRIAAPAAPIPSHLIQQQNQVHTLNQRPYKPSYMSGSYNSMNPFNSHSNGNLSLEFNQPPTEFMISTPPSLTFLPPLTINTNFPPITNNPPNNNGNTLTPSWNKENTNFANSFSKPTYTPLSGNLVKPLIIDNGNGTIDPRWVSPVGSEWSTPSVTRVPSPVSHLHREYQNDQMVVDIKEETQNTNIPQYVWYNPSNLTNLNSSSDSRTEFSFKNDHQNQTQSMDIDSTVADHKDNNSISHVPQSGTYSSAIGHSFETNYGQTGSPASPGIHNQDRETINASNHCNIDTKPYISSPLAPLMNLPPTQNHSDNSGEKENSDYTTPVNGLKWFE